jgi:hypothetical protein
MVDGVSATDRLSVILSQEREPALDEPEPWHAAPEPSAAGLVAHSLTLRAVSAYERTLGKLLKPQGFRLQANHKTREGSQHPARDAAAPGQRTGLELELCHFPPYLRPVLI